MGNTIYRKILDLVLKAAELARSVGIHNILQPGLLKEMIIADILGHVLITTKQDADAHDAHDSSILYEYLSCKEGGTGQFDRMLKEPDEERQKSLNRIRRNTRIYLAIFYEINQTKVKTIYEIDPEVVAQKAEKQLDRSSNKISHVGFSETWARRHGHVVYEDKDKQDHHGSGGGG